MPGARRSVKLPLTELSMKCPHCQAPLIIATVMDVITFGQRTCPKCGRNSSLKTTCLGCRMTG
jgi:primosomal protein N'